MSLEEKTEIVRTNIISAVQAYKDTLVGRKFIYVFEDDYIEVIYGVDKFMHLVGLKSKKLNATKFYEKSKDGTLKRSHMFFSKENPLKTALQKSTEFMNCDIFTQSQIYIVKNITTGTTTYEIVFSDRKMSLGLNKATETGEDGNEKKLDYYFPQTFRVKEDMTLGRDDVKTVKMILSKTDSLGKYDTIEYGDRDIIADFSEDVKNVIDESLY